jgi:hypothetical protein
MTFPGADTIKGGIMGDDCFRSIGIRFFWEPLTLIFAILSVIPFMLVFPFVRGDMSNDGELEVSDAVSMCSDVVLEDRDRAAV